MSYTCVVCVYAVRVSDVIIQLIIFNYVQFHSHPKEVHGTSWNYYIKWSLFEATAVPFSGSFESWSCLHLARASAPAPPPMRFTAPVKLRGDERKNALVESAGMTHCHGCHLLLCQAWHAKLNRVTATTSLMLRWSSWNGCVFMYVDHGAWIENGWRICFGFSLQVNNHPNGRFLHFSSFFFDHQEHIHCENFGCCAMLGLWSSHSTIASFRWCACVAASAFPTREAPDSIAQDLIDLEEPPWGWCQKVSDPSRSMRMVDDLLILIMVENNG